MKKRHMATSVTRAASAALKSAWKQSSAVGEISQTLHGCWLQPSSCLACIFAIFLLAWGAAFMQRVSRSWVRHCLVSRMQLSMARNCLCGCPGDCTHVGEARLQPQLLSRHPTPQSLRKASAPRAKDPTELTLPFLFINKHLCRVTKMY